MWMCCCHLHETRNVWTILTVEVLAAMPRLCAGEYRQCDTLSQCQPPHTYWDLRICWLSLFWASSDVPSPSTHPDGKRPPLRGHEKGTGRLSQHVLAWGLLKAQIHILPYFIFLFLFPLSVSVPPHRHLLKHQPAHIGMSNCLWVFIPPPPMSDYCLQRCLQALIEISAGQ